MENQILGEKSGFEWVDIKNPSESELKSLHVRFPIHESSLEDCLQPEHLPKLEPMEDALFFILRGFDEKAKGDADTIQELTRKIAFFAFPNRMLSLHRAEMGYLTRHFEKWKKHTRVNRAHVVNGLIDLVVGSYEQPLTDIGIEIDQMEWVIFQGHHKGSFLKEAYYLRRRAYVIRKVLKMTLEMVLNLGGLKEFSGPYIQDLREKTEHLVFIADDLLDNVTLIVNLYLSLETQKTNLASHKTNETVRILTLISVFFLPLNFIAGVYGMNFKTMPGLESDLGLYAVLTIMVLFASIMFILLKKKKWL